MCAATELEKRRLWSSSENMPTEEYAQGGYEYVHRQTHNSPKKTYVQNFSSAVRTTEMLFCQEQLPIMKPGFIISTH